MKLQFLISVWFLVKNIRIDLNYIYATKNIIKNIIAEADIYCYSSSYKLSIKTLLFLNYKYLFEKRHTHTRAQRKRERESEILDKIQCYVSNCSFSYHSLILKVESNIKYR